MVRPHKKNGEEKVVKKVTELKLDIRGARGRRWEEQVLEDKRRLRMHNCRGKIQDWSHGRESQKRQVRARHWSRNEGKYELTHHKLIVLKLELSDCYPTRDV